jgi:predicted TIM-barrel enzyme
MTGDAPDIEKVREARALAGDRPLLLGSGTTEQNIAAFMEVADGAIVGSSIKVDGIIENPVDAVRVRRFVRAARAK